jgi:hypothetical protein
MMEVYLRINADAVAVTCCECRKMVDVEDLYEHFIQAHQMRIRLVSND